jgi:hypothetical protein
MGDSDVVIKLRDGGEGKFITQGDQRHHRPRPEGA